MATVRGVEGTVARRFVAVRDVLAQQFRSGSEEGCAICVWHDGELVVDLWGGHRDKRSGAPFEPDTLCTMFSATKGMVALAFLMLADRGELDYDAPITDYWPSFGQTPDKRAVTVRMLLNHRSGLIGVSEPITLDQLERHPDQVCAILERERPTWTPGSSQGYHAVTYGLYAAELFRRITGESLGTFLAREVMGPLGAEVYLGLPKALESRVATNQPVSQQDRILRALPEMILTQSTEAKVVMSILRRQDTYRAFAHPEELGPSGLPNYNTRRVHALELPWGNGLGTARGLCRVYSALANGGALEGTRLVKEAALEPLMERQSWSSRDRVLHKPLGWSQGFLKEEPHLFSPTHESFGHAGAGGALGWCDPKRKIAIGYLTVKMAHHVRSPRTVALCRAVYQSLGEA